MYASPGQTAGEGTQPTYPNTLTKSSYLTDSPFDPADWVSQVEAAEIRGVSRQAIHQLVQKGRFRTYEVAGRTLVFREDVVGYEPEKGGRPPSSDAADVDGGEA